MSAATADTRPGRGAAGPAHLRFAALLAAGAAVFFLPLGQLAQLSRHSELYSHFLLIPLVSAFLLAADRRRVFARPQGRPAAGLPVCALGLLAYAAAWYFRDRLPVVELRGRPMPNDYLALSTAGAVAWVIGAFIAAYGQAAFARARFALLFLAFTIPIPTIVLNPVIRILQHASAEAADLIFALTGAPYFRSGLIFEFPNVSIRVAEVCSGIRSSLALLILAVLTGRMFLQRTAGRLALAAVVFPITVAKNAARIVTITLLANYVDLAFVEDHWLHRSGGIPFFAVAMAMFVPAVWLLRRLEAGRGGGRLAARQAGRAAEG